MLKILFCLTMIHNDSWCGCHIPVPSWIGFLSCEIRCRKFFWSALFWRCYIELTCHLRDETNTIVLRIFACWSWQSEVGVRWEGNYFPRPRCYHITYFMLYAWMHFMLEDCWSISGCIQFMVCLWVSSPFLSPNEFLRDFLSQSLHNPLQSFSDKSHFHLFFK